MINQNTELHRASLGLPPALCGAPWRLMLVLLSHQRLFAFGVFLVILFFAPFSAAQEDKSPGSSSKGLEGSVLPFEARMYLDEDGERVFYLPSVTLEEIRLLKQLDNQKGGYEFRKIEVSATVGERHADVKANFQVQLGDDSAYAEVPLSFGSCQLGLTPPRVDSGGDKEFQSKLEATVNGYRWILYSGRNSSEQSKNRVYGIELSGKSKLTTSSGRSSLRIALPLQSCEIKLVLPANSTDVRPGGEEFLGEPKKGAEGIEYTILSRGGDFNISWKSKDELNRFSSVEADSETRFVVTDPSTPWSATTKMTLRWFGDNQNEPLLLTLPKGARWRERPQGDFERFQVSLVVDDSAADEEVAAQYSLQNIDPDQFSSIEVTLEWEYLPTLVTTATKGLACDIAIPKVSDLDSHRGVMVCETPAEFVVRYDHNAASTFIQRSQSSDSFAWQQLQFGFSKEDVGIRLVFRKEEALPTVRPVYLVEVEKSKLRLTAWLDCSFNSNQRAPNLGLMFGDWSPLENTATAYPVSADPGAEEGELLRIESRSDGSHRVTLPSTERSSFDGNRRPRQIWQLTAEKTLSGPESLEFVIPQIIRGEDIGTANHGAGILIVSSQDEVLLRFQDSNSQGLLPDVFSEDLSRYLRTESIRQPYVFRFQSNSVQPKWVGKANVLPRSVVARESVELTLLQNELQVRQDFDLSIANVPVFRPRIAVPVRQDQAPNATFQRVQFYVGDLLTSAVPIELLTGEQLSQRTERANSNADAKQTWQVYELVAASELRRNVLLRVEYQLPWGSGAAGSASPSPDNSSEQIPLAVLLEPSEYIATTREVSLANTRGAALLGLTRGDAGTNWIPLASQQPLKTSADSAVLLLQLLQDQNQAAENLVVSNIWLQSIIGTEGRQDRFVARFYTTQDEIKIKLNESVNLRRGAWRVVIDGREVRDAYVPSEDLFRIPVSSTEDGLHSVEVIYTLLSSLENWSASKVSVRVPEIIDAENLGRFFWQVATPRTQHLAWTPERLMPEWTWEWNGFWWNRANSRDESNMLRLMRVDEVRLPASTNRYLMSGDLPTQTLSLWVIPRFLLWFPIGLVAIGITVLILNAQWTRSPQAVLLLALLLASAAMIFPDLAFLCGQTALVSVSLVVLVTLTHIAIESRMRRRSVFGPRTARDGSDHISVGNSDRWSDVTKDPQSSAAEEVSS